MTSNSTSPNKYITVLMGSDRPSGNCAGLSSWLLSVIGHHSSTTNITSVSPTSTIYPSNHFSSPIIPAGITETGSYPSQQTQSFSSLITSSSAVIILTPQYNWGYPGALKSAIDNLYFEWKDKPILLITYGGHGGGKCADQLRQVLDGAVHAKVVGSGVQITLPKEYIRGDKRVAKDDETRKNEDVWLQGYESRVKDAFDELINVVEEYREEQLKEETSIADK